MFVYILYTLFILCTNDSLLDDKQKDDVTKHRITLRTNALEPVNKLGKLFVSFNNVCYILFFSFFFNFSMHNCCYPSLSCTTVSPSFIPIYIRLFLFCSSIFDLVSLVVFFIEIPF